MRYRFWRYYYYVYKYLPLEIWLFVVVSSLSYIGKHEITHFPSLLRKHNRIIFKMFVSKVWGSLVSVIIRGISYNTRRFKLGLR